MSKYIGELATKAKANWRWIALFLWVLWATATLRQMKEDIADASNQADFAANHAATRASSSEFEDLKSTVEDLEATVENLPQ